MTSFKHLTGKLEERRTGVSRQVEPDEWPGILKRLAEKLPQDRQWRVTVIGGVAMALGYGGRRTTEDADVINTPPEVIRAARAVATEFALGLEWMNSKAEDADHVDPSVAADTRVVLSEPSLEVHVPSAVPMLATKIARFARKTDVSDAKILLSRLRHLDSVEDVWTHIGGFVPVADRAQAKHNLENLWEMVHGPA